MGSICGSGNAVHNEELAKRTGSDQLTRNTKPGESFQEEEDDDEEDVEDQEEEKYGSPKVYDRMDNRITVHIIQGRHLPKSDTLGESDPYVKVTFQSKTNANKPLEESRTRVKRKTRNPVWNDAVVCQGMGIISDCKAIVFDVWDYDTTTKDDFLGTTTITGIEHMRGSALPVWLMLKDKKGKNAGEIQVQVSVTEDCNTLTIRDWTHVLEVNIGQGTNLGKMPWFKNKHSNPYVRIEWGTQVLHTSKLQNTEEARWNEKAYLFVHEKTNENYYLQITIMDDSAKAEAFGQGAISAQKIFKSTEEAMFEKDVPLVKLQIETDKALSLQNLAAQEDAQDECGTLKVSARLHPKEQVQARYYDALVDHFDGNRNGELDKIEVQQLLLSLDVPQDPDNFFRKYDEDADDIWSKEEIVNMLKDYDFQRSPWMALALENFLKHKLKASFDAHLMTGVTEPSTTGNERTIIKVKDRHTGLVIQENIPGYVWQALQLMYNTTTGRVFTKQMSSVLTKMSSDKGKQYDMPESVKEIPHFIELHNLDMSTMVKKRVEDYATFNDFFARAIEPSARPLHSPNDENVVITPADSRLMVFPTFVDSFIWVKGTQWTIENLLKERYQAVGKKLEGGSFVIARLAPQDYHRFHWPVSGKVTKITPISGALFTVNPISINQPINVYTENKRCIIEVETGEERFGTVLVIPVGATMVGSYRLFEKDGVPLEEGHEVQRGEVAGEFRFGGSTVLLLFEKDRVHFDRDLITNSNEKLETLTQVRDRIGEKKTN